MLETRLVHRVLTTAEWSFATQTILVCIDKKKKYRILPVLLFKQTFLTYGHCRLFKVRILECVPDLFCSVDFHFSLLDSKLLTKTPALDFETMKLYFITFNLQCLENVMLYV